MNEIRSLVSLRGFRLPSRKGIHTSAPKMFPSMEFAIAGKAMIASG